MLLLLLLLLRLQARQSDNLRHVRVELKINGTARIAVGFILRVTTKYGTSESRRRSKTAR
jgi:hypothetical protein